MKWGRFLLGAAAGAAIGYFVLKGMAERRLAPEQIVQMLKEKYQSERMSIIGSWIHVHPQKEKIDGSEYTVYQCGLTGLAGDEPHFYEFKVDADTGDVLDLVKDRRG